MAKQLFIAAFLIDPAEYDSSGDPVDAGYLVSDLAQSSFGEQAGISDFMVWSCTDDFLKDHTERGPINVAYLEGEEAEAAPMATANIPDPVPATVDNLIVVLDGGLVQSVVGTGAYVGRTVHIVDYDTDGADTSELSEIGQGDGGTVDAFYRIETVGKSEIVLPEMEGRTNG